MIRLPRISNFDDFDALALETGVSLRFVSAAGEIHAGKSAVDAPSLFELAAEDGIAAHGDGAVSRDGRIAGTYLHGLFDLPAFRKA